MSTSATARNASGTLSQAQLDWLRDHPCYRPLGRPRSDVVFVKAGTLYADGSFVPLVPMQVIKVLEGCIGVGIEPRTIAALEESIEKWRQIAKHQDRGEHGSNDCALCQLFYMDGCAGCPVAQATLLSHCRATPYIQWSQEQRRLGRVCGTERVADRPELRAAAQREVGFLRSLLPRRQAESAP